MSHEDQQQALARRLRAATSAVESSADLELRVQDRIRVHNRQRTAMRVGGAVGALLVVVAGSLVWLRRPDTPTTVVGASSSTVAGLPSGTSPASGEAAPSSPAPAPDDSVPPSAAGAQNFLVVGSDGRGCTADETGALAGIDGQRSDTIMIVRLDPVAERLSVLSLQRDLWVDVPGRGASRINSTYTDGDPQLLIDTIAGNFGIAIDHFVAMDFCGFRNLIDVLDGVTIPFDRPVRDSHTGLDIASAGCVRLDGDMALAYVRSRHLHYLADDGTWVEDPASDLGRVSRQQDLMARVLAGAADRFTDPDVALALIQLLQDHVIVDSGLTIDAMLGLAGELGHLADGGLGRYQLDVEGRTVAGNAVLAPVLDSPSSAAVLALYRGEPAPAADPAEVPVENSTEGATEPPPADVVVGVVPTNDLTC